MDPKKSLRPISTLAKTGEDKPRQPRILRQDVSLVVFTHFVLLAMAVVSLSSCDLFLAPLFAPHVPEHEKSPRLPIQSVAGWVYSDNKLKVLVKPDYAKVPSQLGIQVYEVYGDLNIESKLVIDVAVRWEESVVGRPKEVVSDWIPIPPGKYEVITLDFDKPGGKYVTTINTEEGHGGIAFDPMQKPTTEQTGQPSYPPPSSAPYRGVKASGGP